MLDTNAASDLARCDPTIDQIVRSHQRPVQSAITTGELMFGLARRPASTALFQIVMALIDTIETLPWTLEAAKAYGTARADCERRGRNIGHLDMLIAAHSISIGATLVTRDKAFATLQLSELSLHGY